MSATFRTPRPESVTRDDGTVARYCDACAAYTVVDGRCENTPPFVDVDLITEYGRTVRLPFVVRVF